MDLPGVHPVPRCLRVLRIVLAALLVSASVSAQAPRHPLCASADADPDGDGWGWQNGRSCVVPGSAVERAQAPALPLCRSVNSDPDGDGYGWEDNRSCRIASDQSGTAESAPQAAVCAQAGSDPDGDGWGYEDGRRCLAQRPGERADSTAPAAGRAAPLVCRSAASDPDGDGWGWEDGRSCKVAGAASTGVVVPPGGNAAAGSGSGHPPCVSAASDSDGDGWGWENNRSCIVTTGEAGRGSNQGGSQAGNQAGNQGSTGQRAAGNSVALADTAGAARLSEVTDVVLVTGQSNVLGSQTAFDATLDVPSNRVFAWTDQGWQLADLHQVWDVNSHPGNFSVTNATREPYNNFAFHFGKRVAAAAPERVPAFIVASAPGKGIAHWDKGSPFYEQVSGKVTAALQALPHKDRVDSILWHQGETDWLYEGTSDPNASGFSSQNSRQYVNYYKIKLEALIHNLRAEPWAQARSAFICGETRLAHGVNRRLMALNSDSDPLTGCVRATDLQARADDQGGSHFSAAALRTLGARYADLYLRMTGR